MPAPLLYVSARPQLDAADAEYASFLSGMGVGPEMLGRHDLVREPLPDDAFERFSGFVVGGSPFNVTDPTSLKTEAQLRLESDLEKIAAAAAESRTAALFTCFGIGVVTRLLGGVVTRDHPEDTGPTTIELTTAGRADVLLGDLALRFAALTAHKEGAGTVPPGAVLLATNEGCPVQAYRVGERLYATQFHPESTPRAFTERMAVYRDGGYFPSRDYDVIAARVLEASVTEPPRLLEAFAERFAA
ncbi:GMP synthase [Microbacterium sp. P06]|uniref:glutamine amidotransferase-related protein n=1 Tax=unclassified Microbacterium TaxID=2609290 RepID=UPI0037458DE5